MHYQVNNRYNPEITHLINQKKHSAEDRFSDVESMSLR